MSYKKGMNKMYDELSVFKQIKDAFPNLSQEECEAALLLLKARAASFGASLEKYIRYIHPYGIAERDEKIPEQYRGYIKFLGNDSTSIIKAGRSADFSTFVHECGHIFRRQLTGKNLQRANKAFGITDNNWTAEKEELFAKGLEEFIKTRQEENGDLKKIYTAGTKFVQNVYKGIGHIVNITPEMEAVYEELFKTNDIELGGKIVTFNQREYEERIDAIADGDKSGTHVLLGATPAIYERLGFERLPMMITREHLERIMHDEILNIDVNYHGISKDILKQIPQQLKSPIAVIQSDNPPQDIVSIIELHDENDNQVIIPISQNAKAKWDNIKINTNLVKSIYGKENFEKWYARVLNENRLLYEDKEKSRTLPRSGSQLRQSDASTPGTEPNAPSVQDISGFYINNIAQYLENNKNSIIVNGERVLFQPAAHDTGYDFGELSAEETGAGKLYRAEIENMPENSILYQSNIDQMMFDFEAEAEQKKEAEVKPVEQARKRTDTPEAPQEEPVEDSGGEEIELPGTIEKFTPVQIDGNILDYTAMPADKVFLVTQKNIRDRPDFIPYFNERQLSRNGFIPLFLKQGDNYLLYEGPDTKYLVTPEIFTATIDFYFKRHRAESKLLADTKNQSKINQAKRFLEINSFDEDELEGNRTELTEAQRLNLQ